MIALTIPRAARCVTIPAPALRQFVGSGVDIQCYHLVAGIDTTSQEDAGLASVQIGRTKEVLRRAVTVAVTPGCFQVAFAIFQSFQWIFHHLVGLTRLTIHIDKVFVTLMYEPLVGVGFSQIVLGGIANDLCRTIGHVDDSTIRSTHHGFCLAVTIPVVGHDVLFVVLEVGHVRAEVYPPKLLTVHLKHFNDEVFAIVTRLLVAGSCPALIVELHQDFQFTVAINVGHTGIIGNVG